MAGNGSQEGEEGINGINVTPLVDITLVLLVIFMVTAKMIVSQSVPLDLPKAASGTELQMTFNIIIPATGSVLVNSKPIPSDDSIFTLAQTARAQSSDLRAIIKADNAVTHGRVIHILDLLKQAGITKVAFGVSPVPPVAPKDGK
ncbi:ExbD/TolR family protein [Pajaroellobacter abortibovis]|uniref:Biopolymer transporter ExbD n=1 Tax=Pajaroellobacter abortibovis TaxID=1882918 RepID=A0A1L6MWI3_9BACT|nr:biopolymer transporter ExbD [Pajaroellobacter abortibovis]APR99881.1 hypothetical protein BCY86_03705 [Pajaroellobacter abortibovis]